MNKMSGGSMRYGLVALLSLASVAAAQSGSAILHAAEAAKLLPNAVFFSGKSASTQLRNAAGVHFSDGKYTLAVLVDTSGYSTGIQEKYQAYLLSEVPLELGHQPLAPGAYGAGFTGGHFVVMDIGADNVLETASDRDAQMHRPMPLQVLDGDSPGLYRLCFGRECVSFRRRR